MPLFLILICNLSVTTCHLVDIAQTQFGCQVFLPSYTQNKNKNQSACSFLLPCTIIGSRSPFSFTRTWAEWRPTEGRKGLNKINNKVTCLIAKPMLGAKSLNSGLVVTKMCFLWSSTLRGNIKIHLCCLSAQRNRVLVVILTSLQQMLYELEWNSGCFDSLNDTCPAYPWRLRPVFQERQKRRGEVQVPQRGGRSSIHPSNVIERTENLGRLGGSDG